MILPLQLHKHPCKLLLLREQLLCYTTVTASSFRQLTVQSHTAAAAVASVTPVTVSSSN
jgi:hypothetical protein